ncbi:MAG: hypothetical protein C4525_13345 [Desulfarculus sp.]|jgi:hypothetical protein|nr:MAG: hypothetical protein C4525_13345 [Desulfarculus sp.]
MTPAGRTELPGIGVVVPLGRIKEICLAHGLSELWRKIEADPPPRPFKSDGCSLWFDAWEGTDLYPACFLHDLKYWAGRDDDDPAERLIADAELMIDVARAGEPRMAEIMFQGVRVGGHPVFRRSFSWGFGRR